MRGERRGEEDGRGEEERRQSGLEFFVFVIRFVDDFDSATLTDDEDENALSLRRAFVVLKTRRILFVEVCLFTCIGRREEVGTKADDDDNAGNIFFSYIKVLKSLLLCQVVKRRSTSPR